MANDEFKKGLDGPYDSPKNLKLYITIIEKNLEPILENFEELPYLSRKLK